MSRRRSYTELRKQPVGEKISVNVITGREVRLPVYFEAFISPGVYDSRGSEELVAKLSQERDAVRDHLRELNGHADPLHKERLELYLDCFDNAIGLVS
ncbi:hypothetical protein COU60_02080 [Candidatus Pacearchaeota archaeon CG10_big_fil_rev_8_21_14_0_10_34_76]|nr:MAG: hypothetical protein COU60_02080 [Candidatus Pacearchaeota archaeon CG10_big_fil_rev_8_21_14_0_10_34_76]